MPSSARIVWSESRFREALTPYCFGGLPESERERVEQHLFECDPCWRELQRLEAAVRTLRSDPRVPALALDRETVAAVTLSGSADRPFRGHIGFSLLASSLYAAVYSASVWTELSYAFDRYGRLLLVLTPVVFGWVSAATLASLWVSARVTRASGRQGLEWSVLILFSAICMLLGGLYFVLPSTPTVAATFATRSAFDGYFKNVSMYFVLLAVAFILVPFHAVVTLTRELHLGRVTNTAAVLTHDPQAFHPRGLWYVRPAWLGAVLLAGVLIGFAGTNRLLDALAPGPYTNLFTRALCVRVALWFVVAATGLAWYWRRLQDLKQVALLLKRLDMQSGS